LLLASNETRLTHQSGSRVVDEAKMSWVVGLRVFSFWCWRIRFIW